MKLLKSAAIGVALSVLGAGAALAAEEMACCKDKAPCCDKVNEKGEKMACCEKHKDHAPQQPAPEHDHGHHH
ncbi:MAG TPA: ammonium transporter family protein [Candidatus Thermoplasmatota archaeon]|nr:ammonium transporter family protein [Candidatus Thermoplasmatota archaeon]